MSQRRTISRTDMLDLEELLHTESEKDSPGMRTDGVESSYWAGTESGLMDIHSFAFL